MTSRHVPSDPQRSVLMAAVRQRGTRAELTVAGILRRLGHAYRLNVRSLPGSPDIANRKRRWAIFVQGCFWHHHTNCRRATVPKSNTDFWTAKFIANRARDARTIRALRASGFKVVTVWECEVAKPDTLTARLAQIFEPGRINVGEPVNHRGIMVDVARLRRRQ